MLDLAGGAGNDGAVIHRPGSRAILLADIGAAVDPVRPVAAGFAVGVPVTIRGKDGEVLLTGVLHRVIGAGQQLAGIDTPGLGQGRAQRGVA